MASKNQGRRNRQKGREGENIVARYFDVWDSRTLASGAGVGDSDIIDSERRVVFEIKVGKQVPALVKKAMKQAVDTADKHSGFDGVSVFIPEGVGKAKFEEEAIVLMRPATLLRFLNAEEDAQNKALPETIDVYIDGKTVQYELKKSK